jgi:16S rRNA (adenine1518-N6/adenine1519-N6)-dimethyltransferase
MSEETRLTSPKEVRELLDRLGHRPNKGMGQNYLIDANILDIIVNTAEIHPDDSVLEIGPGLGALTERILPAARSVTCIEKDPTMAAYLKTRFGGAASPLSVERADGEAVPSFQIIESDALDVDMDGLFRSGITKVAANLPYSVASRLMVEMAECACRPRLLSLTIQKEVAERLTAEPGSRHYGILGILTGVYYENRMVKKISPACFLPPPKVWSAVVQMVRRAQPAVEEETYPLFKKLVKSCFSQRRKMIGTILKNLGISPVDRLLADAGIEHEERPEKIEISRWAALAERLAG